MIFDYILAFELKLQSSCFLGVSAGIWPPARLGTSATGKYS